MAASPVIQRFFNGSCQPIQYRCVVNTNYINPCSCTSHYQCVTDTSIILRPCSEGTGYDHEVKTCRGLTDIVLDKLCDQEHPWERCLDVEDYVDVDEDALWRRCTNTTPPTTPPPDNGGGGVDGGLIAGVIIAVLLIVVITAVVIIYVRKRGNPLRHLTSSRGDKSGSRGDSANNQSTSASRYKTGPGEEETYAEIEDTALYKEPGGKPLSHTQSHSNETYDRDIEEGVSYDNPALQRDTPPLPDRDSNLTPPEYSPLEEKEQAIRSYSSLNEHRANATAERNPKEPITGDDGYLVAEAIGQSNRSSDPTDPNYFVLENS